MYRGRFSSVATSVMTLMAPWMRSAAPQPATALPSMNTGELGAAAHKAEPATEVSGVL